MLHMLAFSKSTDATVDVDITPVSDDIVPIVNAHFFPQQDVKVVAAVALATTLTRAKIVTPTLRQISPPFIRPIITANLPITLPGVADYSDYPLTLRGLEEISIQATQTAAGPTQCNVGLLIDDGQRPPAPQGTMITMRGTGATTLAANTWTSLIVTWADTLPAGNYACVGLQVKGATAILARMIFFGQTQRPGCLAQTLMGDNGHPMFRKGVLGTWGYFTGTRMPVVQVLANAADTTQEIYMDIVRIG